MNKRILELANQAGIQLPAVTSVYNGHIYQNSIERFAKLIVKECINIGDNYQEILVNEPECANCRKVAYGIVDKIKKHYGITE